MCSFNIPSSSVFSLESEFVLFLYHFTTHGRLDFAFPLSYFSSFSFETNYYIFVSMQSLAPALPINLQLKSRFQLQHIVTAIVTISTTLVQNFLQYQRWWQSWLQLQFKTFNRLVTKNKPQSMTAKVWMLLNKLWQRNNKETSSMNITETLFM